MVVYTLLTLGENEDTSVASTVHAGITYCGTGYNYTSAKAEYFIEKTKTSKEFESLLNFDAESSVFRELCFSTCCWSLFVSPEK